MKINGKPVVDAKRALVISVTPRDVKAGDRKKRETCAAALACVRQLHAKSAMVGLSKTYVELGDKWVRYCTPVALRTEVAAFDRGADFTPDDYRLRAPGGGDKLGSGRNEGRKRGPHKTKRKPYHKLAGVRALMTHADYESGDD